MPRHSSLLIWALLSVTSLATHAPSVYKGDGTFYSPSVGLGSCGKQYQDTDKVAALAAVSMRAYNPSNPNNNPLCGHKVKVWNTAKPSTTVTVAIVDTCPGCAGHYDLDLSPGAFNQLANPSVGRIHISWEFVEAVSLATGPFAGAVPAGKVAVNQKVISNPEVAESRNEL
ncbi:MAG: hypothetical protein Q9175_008368 [Cornicularia normoerica]